MPITLAQANTVVVRRLKKGRETSCAPLSVAVLDAGGHLVAFQREDRSGILRSTSPSAKPGARSAWASARVNCPTAPPRTRCSSAPSSPIEPGTLRPRARRASWSRTAMQVVGSVGISGDTSDKDEACALAGIEAAGLKGQVGAP